MNQGEFDFDTAERDRALSEHWERLERLAREEMSEENLCLAWVTDSDGRAWREWWQGLPTYERSQMLASYRSERAAGGTMRPYCIYRVSDEELAAHRSLVTVFADGIREAALARKPIPFRESPGMTGAEKIYFSAVLNEALRKENVIIIEASQPH